MSELALRLIAENKVSKNPFLDLGRCSLSSLPEELGELVWLETLVLADDISLWNGTRFNRYNSMNKGKRNITLDDLAPVAKLLNLQALYVSGTQIDDLTPVAGLGKLQYLFASQTEITTLLPIANLSNLKYLDVSNTQIDDLGPIADLKNLENLDLSETQIDDISPIATLRSLRNLYVSSTLIGDLSPIAALSNLQCLYCIDTQIEDLAPIADLINLQYLEVSENQIADLSPIAALNKLQYLGVSQTQVIDLSPVASLINLEHLDISYTKIADLSPIASLCNLQSFGAENSQISDLSPIQPLIQAGHKVVLAEYGGAIRLENCQLTIPPIEIVSQGNEAILNYFEARKRGSVEHLYEAKMLILGEGGAGKTSLLRRLYQTEKTMPAEEDSTKGIAIHVHNFPLKNGKTFRLNVWDFGGQEIYHATHQFFLTNRSLYVLLDDTRKDHKTVSDPGFKDWLDLIELFGGNSPVLIFQNEKSGRSKEIALSAIKGRYANVLDCFKGDLIDAKAADAMRDAIDYYISKLDHIGAELPVGWLQVRAEIETVAAQNAFITQQAYFDIYARHLLFDRTEALHLSRYLHDLGVFLHFQDDTLLARTVILKNEWATLAVYALLDDEAIKHQLGRFTKQDYQRLWHKPEYADMHPELLALMKNFELCYELPDCPQDTWLAPELLPVNIPAKLENWAQAGDLVLHYRYAYLPKGILSRLMVRLHRFVRDPNLACISCILFERDNTQVLVQKSDDGREIHLRARGPERKGLLAIVAADLDAINAGFNNLVARLDKLVPCNCKQCINSAAPHLFEEKALRKRIDDNRQTVECPQSYQDVMVLTVLDGISTEHLPTWKDDEPASSKASNTQPAAMRKLKVFISCAEELTEDRNTFELYFRQQNDDLRENGVYLEFVHWQTLPCAMSATRSMDDCIAALKDCDVLICLYHNKVGDYALEEFNAAWAHFNDCKKPWIFTWFKTPTETPSRQQRAALQSVWDFQDKLEQMGHFPSEYKSIADLKLQFVSQLKHLLQNA